MLNQAIRSSSGGSVQTILHFENRTPEDLTPEVLTPEDLTPKVLTPEDQTHEIHSGVAVGFSKQFCMGSQEHI